MLLTIPAFFLLYVSGLFQDWCFPWTMSHPNTCVCQVR